MIEIESKNGLGLKVFINGIPDMSQIPPEEENGILSVLELDIFEFNKNWQEQSKIVTEK